MWPFDRFRAKAATKTAAKPALQVRRYAAARPDRLVNGFKLGMPLPMEENRLDLKGLVAHSRHLAQNNDYFRAFLLLCRRHIPGPHGIQLQSMAMRPDGTRDETDAKLIETRFADWCTKGSPTVCGRFSFVEVEWMLAMMVPRDGGVFIRHFRGKEHGPFGYRFQILTVDQLDTDFTAELRDGGYISGGVECDGLDRPVAWHFRRRRAGSIHGSSGERIRIPASDLTYVGVPEDYSVHLSMPWGHTALRRMNMLGGFEEAALTAARAGASKMGFFTRATDDDGETVSKDGPDIEEMDPGSMETLPPGWDIKEFDTGYPDGESPLFVKLMLRGAAAGLGVSYNGIANDPSDANFASMHVGKAEERDEWRILQTFYFTAFHAVVFREWLTMSMLTGALPLPMAKFDKFARAEWKPRGWAAVNPVDEAKANQANVASGFTSPQRIAAAKGADIADIYRELGEAKKLAEQNGITLTFAANAATAPNPSGE